MTVDQDVFELDVRCPRGRLFAKLLSKEQRPQITPENLMEFACHDCKRKLTDKEAVKHVLHRFDFLGDLIETEVVYADGRSEIR